MEFKDRQGQYNNRMAGKVLIESDWNLKESAKGMVLKSKDVLIESDWNLKMTQVNRIRVIDAVLIESDWNLKVFRRPHNLCRPLQY